MNELKKMNQLKVVESFIQVNYIKGYKYIDKAGEIVNNFHKGTKPPLFRMNIDGLVITNPNPNIKEIKVTPSSFWAHYINPGSLDQIKNLFSKNIKLINDIISPESYSRLGWRNFFILETNKQEQEAIFKNFLPNESYEFRQLSFSVKTSKFENNITVIPVFKEDDPNSPAILFDIDTFIAYQVPVGISEVESDLIKMWESLGGYALLGTLNSIIVKKKSGNGNSN